jgi:hypothetical protein
VAGGGLEGSRSADHDGHAVSETPRQRRDVLRYEAGRISPGTAVLARSRFPRASCARPRIFLQPSANARWSNSCCDERSSVVVVPTRLVPGAAVSPVLSRPDSRTAAALLGVTSRGSSRGSTMGARRRVWHIPGRIGRRSLAIGVVRSGPSEATLAGVPCVPARPVRRVGSARGSAPGRAGAAGPLGEHETNRRGRVRRSVSG